IVLAWLSFRRRPLGRLPIIYRCLRFDGRVGTRLFGVFCLLDLVKTTLPRPAFMSRTACSNSALRSRFESRATSCLSVSFVINRRPVSRADNARETDIPTDRLTRFSSLISNSIESLSILPLTILLIVCWGTLSNREASDRLQPFRSMCRSSTAASRLRICSEAASSSRTPRSRNGLRLTSLISGNQWNVELRESRWVSSRGFDWVLNLMMIIYDIRYARAGSRENCTFPCRGVCRSLGRSSVQLSGRVRLWTLESPCELPRLVPRVVWR